MWQICVKRSELPPRVFFDEFNPDSLNSMIASWYHPRNAGWRWPWRQCDAAGTRLAVPTSKTLFGEEGRRPGQAGLVRG
ncbi:MAG: hypothetical protein U9P00_03485 [Pseudomonadota bacterium]|nr:hypothetical protein [Pseudomonadota bacterium]